MARWIVFTADRAGSVTEVFSHDEPQEVLRFMREGRLAHPWPERVYGCWDDESPESGDAEARLEEMVEEARDESPHYEEEP